jgi:N-methylhydantoinase A
MRFVGQGAETNVPVRAADFTVLSKAEARGLFDDVYKKLYGRTYPDSEVEFINFKVRASLPEKLLQLPRSEKKAGQTLDQAIKGQRLAYSPIARDFIPFTVYDRYKLFPTAHFRGPAIIEEKESTLIVGEDASITSDEFGFLWIDLKQEA